MFISVLEGIRELATELTPVNMSGGRTGTAAKGA